MMHKAWSGTEEVPYCFSRPSIIFQGHTGWKIDDMNQILSKNTGPAQICLVFRKLTVLYWDSTVSTTGNGVPMLCMGNGGVMK